jgi:hypothetical protein
MKILNRIAAVLFWLLGFPVEIAYYFAKKYWSEYPYGSIVLISVGVVLNFLWFRFIIITLFSH